MASATSKEVFQPTPKPGAVRVIVVDDSSVMRGLITRVLEAEGISVVGTAADAATALTMLKRLPPHKVEADVLVLEVKTPVKNSSLMVKELKKAAPTMQIIVAATLNESNVMQSIDALDQGASELVAKPSSRKNPEETKIFVQELLLKVKKLSGLE